jgi:hypothetical protein
MLPDFLFCENKSALPGAGLILYTKAPYWMGQVMKFDSHEAWEHWSRSKHHTFAIGKVLGYSIAVVGIGAMGDYKLPTTHGTEADTLANVYRRMADFYMEEKINRNLNYFKRYSNDNED